jgi:hypothetical protein
MNHTALTEPVFILCPGRSFTSVICGMLGEHPELYGVPELNLFLKDTMGQLWIAAHQSRGGGWKKSLLNGLVRVVAQIHDGEQSEEAAIRALAWVEERGNWSTARMYYYLQEKLNPRGIVDKSPPYGAIPANLERLHAAFPNARYLHISRHPRPTCKSMHQIYSGQQSMGKLGMANPDPRHLEMKWCQAHRNIMLFTRQLPLGQSMFLQGEEILAEPEQYLLQLTQWLGIDGSTENIERMLHPETSPYACFGPPSARGGNNLGFLENPRLRRGRPREAFLDGPLEFLENGGEFRTETKQLARQLGYR